MNARKRTVMSVMVALCLGAVLPGVASAGTLDQQQTASENFYVIDSGSSLAQTFTAGISGSLDRVDLLLSETPSSGLPPVKVDIRDVGSVGPAPTVLASASIPAASIPQTFTFVPATFASPAAVAAGRRYAIVAYSGTEGSYYKWGAEVSADLYPGGAVFSDTTNFPPGPSTLWNLVNGGKSDLAFKTYVVPAPTPAATKKCKHKKKHKSGAVIAKKCKKKHH